VLGVVVGACSVGVVGVVALMFVDVGSW